MQSINKFKLDTMDGNKNTKNAVHNILEQFSEMVGENRIRKNSEFKSDGIYLYLDVKTIFNRLLEKNKSLGLDLELTQNSFTKMLREEPYFKDYKPRRFSESFKPLKSCFILDYKKMEILALEGLEIHNLLEIELQEDE